MICTVEGISQTVARAAVSPKERAVQAPWEIDAQDPLFRNTDFQYLVPP